MAKLVVRNSYRAKAEEKTIDGTSNRIKRSKSHRGIRERFAQSHLSIRFDYRTSEQRV